MPQRKIADLVASALLVAVGAFVYVQSAAMPAARRGLGPGGYPKFIAIGLVVFGIALAIQFLKKPGSAAAQIGKSGKIGETESAQASPYPRLGRAFAFVLLCLAYSQAIQPLGFIIASVIFLLVAINFFGYRRHAVTIAVSVLLPVALYLVFRHFFLVLIPTGTIFR